MKFYNSLLRFQQGSVSVSFPILCFLFFTLSACQHKIATSALPKNQIVFGGGGGFTGASYEYSLLQDGRLVAIQRDSATQKVIKNIGKKKAASLYAAVDSMRLNTWLYNVPGNIYHFIILKQDGKKDNKIVWDGSGNDKSIPELAEGFYKKLMAEVPKKK
ncbi:MAG: hypothetical protein JNL70_16800 [Saprospiraceae bacterium]|nr:hypothetical protein [Saprospiraceae bacterium]